MQEDEWLPLQEKYRGMRHEFDTFRKNVEEYLSKHPELVENGLVRVHSTKSRLKDEGHLREKIIRKRQAGRHIDSETVFREITDLAGVRVLHLFRSDLRYIDAVIRRKVASRDWHFDEGPKAMTWDPETIPFFESLGLKVEARETAYTSVHYVVRPRQDSPLCCEIQVRTLFEEIWGEVDHRINYPTQCDDIATVEQLRVLSKIVGAGSRLVDSIERTLAAGRET